MTTYCYPGDPVRDIDMVYSMKHRMIGVILALMLLLIVEMHKAVYNVLVPV